jgi:predicted ATPase
VQITLACGHTEKVSPEQVTRWNGERCDDCRALAERRLKEEQRHKLLSDRQDGAGIPKQYHGRRLRDLAGWSPELLFACNQWVQEGGGLYLWSENTGTGKTSAAADAAWEMLDRRAVSFVPAARLVYWGATDFGSDERKAASKLAGSPSALVLDDFGEEPTSFDAALLIKTAIQSRLDAEAPLIITSNMAPGAACERDERARTTLGRRLASRIQGYCAVIEVQGHDHRLEH